MVTVHYVNRKSAVLVPSSLACLAHIPTVNLTSGCAHGCLYCYTRGYSNYPGENRINLYANTLEKIRKELDRKRSKPRAVYFSPSSDIFQPVPEVLDMTYEILALLFDRGIGVAFLTKGGIPKEHLQLLKAHAPQVRAQIGLTTLDEKLLAIIEPGAGNPSVRLDQVKKLISYGIPTQVRLDPIMPGLTDDENCLVDLLSKLAQTGVQRIAASTLFLRSAVIHTLKQYLKDRKMLESLLKHFEHRSWLHIHANKSRVLALPQDARRQIYTRLERIASQYGILVRLCACKNPDIAVGSCSIAGDWQPEPAKPDQPNLFDGS